jgi:photosystem II stability/assembly factor-like uncharacterized protein
MSFIVRDSNIIAGTYSGIYRSIDNGNIWNKITNGIPNNCFDDIYVYCFAASGNNIFAGTGGRGVFLSTDKGTSWIAVNNGLTNDSIFNSFRNLEIRSFATIGSNIFAGTNGGGVFRSVNNGTSWSAVNSGITDSVIMTLAACNGCLFAGTPGGLKKGGIFRSIDSGKTWTTVNKGIQYDPYSFNGQNYYPEIKVLAANDSSIYAVTSRSGAFVSTNNGNSWSAFYDGSGRSISMFSIKGPNIITVNDKNEGSLSINNGLTWFSINSEGLKRVQSFDMDGNNIFAATWGNGIWRRQLSEIVTGVDFKSQNISRSLYSFKIAFTKMAKHSLDISFTLARPEQVTLKIYNLYGCLMYTLVNKNLAPGKHNITWNTKNISTGFYVMRMQAGHNMYAKSILISP